MAKLTKRKQTKSSKQVQENATKANTITNRKRRKNRPQKRFLYSQEALEQAIAIVTSKTCSLNKAAKQYGIPVGTLFNKVNGISPLKRRMGPCTVLTEEEEKRIKQWILDKAEIGYPMHHMIVREAVKKVLDKIDRPNPFKNNMPGRKWLKLFLNRHPEIKNKRTEMLSRVRAAVTEPRIRAWFGDVIQYLSKADALDVLSDPTRIFNLDETGVCLCPKTGKLLAPVKQKNVYSISPGQERQQITVLCCFSASGVSVRPMIMYPYKRSIPHEIINSVPDGYSIGHSETGWMTTASFYEYIVNCFYPQLLENGVQFPVILFFDGHSSHISIELHDFCAEKQILLYCFIAHASHIMQPLDVGVFRPLKLCWRKAVAAHAQKSNKVITKVNFAPVFHNAFTELLQKPEIIEKSFERSGLYPFNADKVDYSKCITYRRENIKKSMLDESDSAPAVCASPSVDIECQIPKKILAEFETHLFLGTEPIEEKILFSIWKKMKQPGEKLNDLNSLSDDLNDNVLESIETAVITHESVLNLEDQNVQHFDQSLLVDNVSIEFIDCGEITNSYSAAVGIGQTNTIKDSVNVQTKENLDENMQVNLEKMTNMDSKQAKEVLQDEVLHVHKEIEMARQTTGDDTLAVETAKPIDFSNTKITSETTSTNFMQNEDGNSNDSGVYTDTSNSFQSKTITEQDDAVLDLSKNSKIKNNINTSTQLALSTTPSVLNENVLLNPFSNSIKQIPFGGTSVAVSKDFSKIVGDNIHVKKELLDHNLITSQSNIAQVWKEHLHFPRIETSKVKKTKVIQAPIYALTSEQWKKEYLRKKEEEEKLKQEKETKKKVKEEEKLFKQKIKIEEIENKKKNREEEKMRKQKIKQEEVECRKKLKEQEKLKKIEEKIRQNKMKKGVQQKIDEKHLQDDGVFANIDCVKEKGLRGRKRQIKQIASPTDLKGTDIPLIEKENSKTGNKNVRESKDSSSSSKNTKSERILREKKID